MGSATAVRQSENSWTSSPSGRPAPAIARHMFVSSLTVAHRCSLLAGQAVPTVGVGGFEPPISCSQSRRLSH